MEHMEKEIKNFNPKMSLSQTIEDITDKNYNDNDIEILRGEIFALQDRINNLEAKIK